MTILVSNMCVQINAVAFLLLHCILRAKLRKKTDTAKFLLVFHVFRCLYNLRKDTKKTVYSVTSADNITC